MWQVDSGQAICRCVISVPITSGTSFGNVKEKSFFPQVVILLVGQYTNSTYTGWEGNPYHISCYSKIPKKVRRDVERRLKEEKKAKIKREKLEQQKEQEQNKKAD